MEAVGSPPTRTRSCEQLAGWIEQGIPRVKMKVGREPDRDRARVRAARAAIGEDAALFVDANGAYERKDALRFAEAFADLGAVWMEEPVSSDDMEGLRLIRDRAAAGMEVRPGSTGMTSSTFTGCWMPGPLTSCRRTSPAAEV